MINEISKCQNILTEYLESYGYETDNMALLGHGSEGVVFSTDAYIFKYFFNGIQTFSEEKLTFIRGKFVSNENISGNKGEQKLCEKTSSL